MRQVSAPQHTVKTICLVRMQSSTQQCDRPAYTIHKVPFSSLPTHVSIINPLLQSNYCIYSVILFFPASHAHEEEERIRHYWPDTGRRACVYTIHHMITIEGSCHSGGGLNHYQLKISHPSQAAVAMTRQCQGGSK